MFAGMYFPFMTDPLQATVLYSKKITALEQELAVLKKKRNRIAWVRFAIVLLTGYAVYWFHEGSFIFIIALLAIGIAGLLYAVSIDTDNKEAISNTERLMALNQDEIEVMAGNYLQRDNGKRFEIPHHPYAQDLDIFGDASLYQYINRCTSEQGQELLAGKLLSPQSPAFIRTQQEAAKELATLPDWCHQFLSYGKKTQVTSLTEKRILQWLSVAQTEFTAGWWKWFVNLYSLATLSSIVLLAFDIISLKVFSILATAFIVFSFSFTKKILPTYTLLSRIVKEINILYYQLNWLEKQSFTSEYLQQLQAAIKSNTQQAAVEIQELKDILQRFDTRLNIYLFIFLNGFLLWDIRQMQALYAWRQRNAANVQSWFETLAAIEVSISLAALTRNNPQWSFPVIADNHFVFESTNLGHPLIPATRRVPNSFAMQGTAQISLVTGSNMGGKSTFLRSIGINTVLALTGAPVCATQLRLSVFQLMSSMRIADNLAESTSTFYAELKKLQNIIEAVNQHKQVFILLDEILRGTNSLDRHTGSKALIKQLVQQQAVAVIATHDVELAKMEEDIPAITNYHFDVQVANDELFFDYKLKNGICQSLNASILMRKIGIEI